MNTTYNSTGYAKCFILSVLMVIFSMSSINAIAQDIEGGGAKTTDIGGSAKAEKLYNALAYHDAIPLYESYLQKHDSARAMAQLGDCYRQTSRFDKAEYWYEKAVAKGDAEPKYKLYLAQMQQINGKYEDAAKWYAKYKEEVPEDRRSANEMAACADYGQFLMSRDRYTVQDLPFNSAGYDFSSTTFDGGLIYSSSRDSSKAISRESTWTGTEFFDMWYVKGDKTSFGKPQRLKGDAATKYHEGVITFTPDKNKVLFTRNNYNNGKVNTSTEKIVNLSIFESKVDGKTWKDDKPFAYNNNEYSTGHPALSPDGNTLYFISDMPGGYGSTDIYVSRKEGDNWSVPKNLGPEINTEGREMFPYVDSDNILYFASDGHGGLGGLDIFKVKQNEKTGKWSKIRNIGSPINSSYDDFSLHFGSDKSYGYFTSNRPDGKGLDDIYGFTDDGVYLEGIVVDAQTGEPICASKVIMKAKVNQSEQGNTTTECDGEFEFNVVKNADYCFVGSADGYNTNDNVCATTKGVSQGGKVFVKIPLTKKKDYAMQITVLGKTSKGNMPLPNAKILLSSQCEGWTKAFTTDENGKICETVRCDCDYIVVANAQGYLPGSTSTKQDNNECSTDRKCGVNPKEVEVILDNLNDGTKNSDGSDLTWDNVNKVWRDKNGNVVETNTSVELKDIYYDFDKWSIRAESEPELNKLLGFLQENPAVTVEIGSYTDSRAPYDYNIKLSQRRAQSVVDWLISKGIKSSRLKPKGYGETQPRNNCTDGVPCSEYEHQRNRRTEFRVLGNNIDVKSLERFDMQVDPCKVCPF